MPYNCNQCGGTFCSKHRLPENHDCPGLDQWNDPDGVFDSGFDDSVQNQGGRSKSITDRLGIDTGPGGPLGYFRGNMTYVFLVLMWLTFLAQLVASAVLNVSVYWPVLFSVNTIHIEYVWTWVISVFAHAGFGHIAINSIIIYFFGRLVEDYIGSRDFAILFIVSGVLAGLGQTLIALAMGELSFGLGASGAALALMGVLTILNPDLKVYIWMVLPVPVWVLTVFYAGYSVLGIGAGIAPGVGHLAHLIGLGIGLLYGSRVKNEIRTPNQVRFGGGGGPGGPGGPGRGRF